MKAPRYILAALTGLLFLLLARPAAASSPGFSSDLSTAITVAQRYWSSKIVGFQPISRIVPYTKDGELSCGLQPIPAENAAYCPVGDFIAYDSAWSEKVYDTMGDAFVFYLLGHEYGHGIQQRLGISYQFTINQELQADCFAGAMIGDSIRDGDLKLDTGDVDELKAGLISVGDPPDEPWFKEGAHGSPAQRTASFFGGYDSGLDACDLPVQAPPTSPATSPTTPSTFPAFPGTSSTPPSTFPAFPGTSSTPPSTFPTFPATAPTPRWPW